MVHLRNCFNALPEIGAIQKYLNVVKYNKYGYVRVSACCRRQSKKVTADLTFSREGRWCSGDTMDLQVRFVAMATVPG